MRAIILAAGEGKRLRPLTVGKPKCLVEYKGKPLLDYQLEVLRKCGIKDIVIVKGYKAEKVLREGVQFAFNKDFDSTNMVHSFFCAEELFHDDMIVSYGDIVYEACILKSLLNSMDDFSIAVSMNWKELWEKRMEDPLSDAETMKMDKNDFIYELGQKPSSFAEIQGQYIGLFRIKGKMVETIKKIYQGLDRRANYEGRKMEEMFMTTFIQIIINQGYPVKGIKTLGEWIEIDSINDLKVNYNF